MDYVDHGVKSLKGLYKNPVLIVPDLFMYLVTYLMTIFFYKSSNLDVLIEQFILMQAIKFETITEYLATNFFHFFVYGSVFVLLTFFVGVGVDMVRFRLIKRLVQKRDVSLRKVLFSKKPYYLKLVFLKAYVYVLTLFMLIISTVIIILIIQLDNTIVGIIMRLFGLFFGIAIIFFIKLAIMYRYPTLFLGEEKHSYKILTRSLKLFLRKTWPVVTIWMIIIFAGLGIWVLMSTIGLLANQLQPLISSQTILYLLSAFVALLVYTIKLTYNIWEYVFLFHTYDAIKKSS